MLERNPSLLINAQPRVQALSKHITWPLAGAVGVGTAALLWLLTGLGENQSNVYASVGMTVGGLIAGAATLRRLDMRYELTPPRRYAILIGWSLAAAAACYIGLLAAYHFVDKSQYYALPNTPLGGALGGFLGCTLGGLVTVLSLPRGSVAWIDRVAALIAWSLSGSVGGFLTMMLGTPIAAYSLALWYVGWFMNWAFLGALGGFIAGLAALSLLSSRKI